MSSCSFRDVLVVIRLTTYTGRAERRKCRVVRSRRHDPDAALPDSRRVESAPHAAGAVAQDVGVDHRRRDVAVTEELLHGADVVAAIETVRRKGVRNV
jgi:hypothetical protein